MAIYSWFTHKKLRFSILMSVYQRVILKFCWKKSKHNGQFAPPDLWYIKDQRTVCSRKHVISDFHGGVCGGMLETDACRLHSHCLSGSSNPINTSSRGPSQRVSAVFFSGGFKEKQTDLPLGMIWIWFSCLRGFKKGGQNHPQFVNWRRATNGLGYPTLRKQPYFKLVESTKHSRLVWRILKGIWNKKPFCFWW